MNNYFITFKKTRKLLKENYLFILDSVDIPVKDVVLHILVEDIYSSIDLPPFTNIAMGNFAVKFGIPPFVGEKLRGKK